MILNTVILIFVVLELMNVIILYFKPDFPHGNSMLAFKGWQKSQENENTRLFANYLVKWVANCKLIFVVLLLVIVLFGSDTIKVLGIAASILSIGAYFITLHPIIKKLDALGEISPKGYSKTLAFMIAGFMLMFAVGLIIHFLLLLTD